MATNKKPYGPAYHQMAARYAIEAGCKGNTMGILYCLFTKLDWTTGETRQIAHCDLGGDMGGLGFNTVRKCIRELRSAGIIDYAGFRGKGVMWSNGEGQANRYTMKLPPVQNLDRGVDKKRPDPRPKNVHHYHSPSLSDGGTGCADAERMPASRGQEATDRRPQTPEEIRQFSKWVRMDGYGKANELWQQHVQAEALAAE